MSEVKIRMGTKQMNQYTICSTCGKEYKQHRCIGNIGNNTRRVICSLSVSNKYFTITEQELEIYNKITELLLKITNNLLIEYYNKHKPTNEEQTCLSGT